jgi:hypothetical protein
MMGQMMTSMCEGVHATEGEVHVPRPNADVSRTLAWQYILNLVLPAFALVSMAALTIIMIVLLVTTVANAGWHLMPSYVSVDPSLGW